MIAHRTCPRHAPENSLEGVDRAAELGADAVEMDVRLTRDGTPVLLHDAVLWRTARVPFPVRWVGGQMARRLRDRRGCAPPLSEALHLASSRGLRPVLDVKAAGAAPSVIRLLEVTGIGPVSLWSQHVDAVARFVSAGVGDDVALLRDTGSTAERERLLHDARRLGAGAVSAHWDAVDARFVRQAGDAGLRVYSWCQWRDRHAEKVGFGLAGVVTDWPDVARQVGL